MESNLGLYYVYDLLLYPFVISIKKSIYTLSETGIFLFTASIISVLRATGDIFQIVLLTESAEHIQLTTPSLLTSSNNNLSFVYNATNCISIGSNLCSQIWVLEANVECPYSFTGNYGFQFDLNCNNNTECIDFVNIIMVRLLHYRLI